MESAIENNGFAMLRSIYSAVEAEGIGDHLILAMRANQSEAIRRSDVGHIFACRNLLSLWPLATSIWRKPRLIDVLTAVLGREFGLVRGLFFDKPPDHTWSLPWHQDLTIAVRDNRISGKEFRKPTMKIGVPHVEAPVWLLENMLFARIHLDDANNDNGVLWVIPGSHKAGKQLPDSDKNAEPTVAATGDVLVIRPLVAHCSRSSIEDTSRHRRIIHLEFAGTPRLMDGYEWFQFIPGL